MPPNSLHKFDRVLLFLPELKLPDGSTRLTVFHTFPILRVCSEKQLYLAQLLLVCDSLFSSTGINTSTALLGFITHNVLAKARGQNTRCDHVLSHNIDLVMMSGDAIMDRIPL